MQDEALEGSYLIRDYSKDTHEYILGVIYKGAPTHHLLKIENGIFQINGTKLDGCTTLAKVGSFSRFLIDMHFSATLFFSFLVK